MPPARKTHRNKRGNPMWNRHNDAYWARLRRDFKTCSYQNGSAYSPIEGIQLSDGVNEFRTKIRTTEAKLKSVLNQRLNRAATYDPEPKPKPKPKLPKSTRLDRVATYARAKKPLD